MLSDDRHRHVFSSVNRFHKLLDIIVAIDIVLASFDVRQALQLLHVLVAAGRAIPAFGQHHAQGHQAFKHPHEYELRLEDM